jgi:drug/metabolite transporter (DMT)-like permease
MPYLIVVSFIWAFSFGLTKGQLAGVDSTLISAARLGLALLVFAPFLRVRGISRQMTMTLVAIGAVQFGFMYLALNESYRYLKAYEVVLLTLVTPVLVTLIADAFERTFRLRALLAALLAVGGAACAVGAANALRPALIGVGLVQLSNVAFAFGQVQYRQLRRRDPALRDASIFALLYAGAFAVAVIAACLRVEHLSLALTGRQIATLLYLGVLASGICFFLWNVGATRVSSGTLAVMNNAKVPLGVACSLLFFGEQASPIALVASLVLLGGAVLLADPHK